MAKNRLQIFRRIDSLRLELKRCRQQNLRIATVPTMGNLHEGHIQLIEMAKQKADIVVATIFVNQLQFNLNQDWEQYPRTFESDCEQLNQAGCDYLFYPEDREIYPNGLDRQTLVICPYMVDILCGASRPGHFQGVTTVVAKLFNIIEPNLAIFGEKDYQQLVIIRRMVEDLCLNVEIIGAPIAREPSQLAYSSRNRFILSDERPRVNQLYLTLEWVKNSIEAGNRDYFALEQQALKMIEAQGFTPDYISIREIHELQNATQDDTQLSILGAMYTKKARLIDNLSVNL